MHPIAFVRNVFGLCSLSQGFFILERACPGLSDVHAHDHAWGHVKVDGVWHSKAAAAGRYPIGLCEAWSEATAAACSRASFGTGLVHVEGAGVQGIVVKEVGLEVGKASAV